MRWSAPSRSRQVEIVLVAAAFVAAAFLVLFVPAPVRADSPSIPATGRTVRFDLYGNAGSGWGLTAAKQTNPGPYLRVSAGDTVKLTLHATDVGVPHNWFLDYDNNKAPGGGEPSSPQFGGSNPATVAYSFVADRLGNFTYRCEIHPGTMTGFINVTVPSNYTLYGNADTGWGLTPGNITNPGPILIAKTGQNLTLFLYSADRQNHTWFIDYDNSKAPGTGEPSSREFNDPVRALTFSFAPDKTGNYTYRCGIHVTTMTGFIVIVGASAAGPAGFQIGLIPGLMLATIVVVLGLAVVYQVRAVRAHRKQHP